MGSPASLRCVSVAPATMIQWFDSNGAVVAMTTGEDILDLSFSPIDDTLHDSMFTCRVTRLVGEGGTGELNTRPLRVIGECILLTMMSSFD